MDDPIHVMGTPEEVQLFIEDNIPAVLRPVAWGLYASGINQSQEGLISTQEEVEGLILEDHNVN